ncbi:hypothetical protein K438DRAFT_831033 [Mycena galopus ATCC 62051]|nr:hypothetical protein K438DRAFT_831033 [Mycena galopus ATCC 62051]
MHFLALASLALVSSVSAVDILVTVGENSTTTYTPNSVTANVGDNVVFQFVAGNHSTFADPCAIMTTPIAGIDSGFQFVAANATQVPQWSFQVTNATTPLWFFCRQTGHCAKGMVFSVNAATTGNKTFAAFQAAAMGTSTASAGAASGTPAPSGALATRTSVAGLVLVGAGVVAGLLL